MSGSSFLRITGRFWIRSILKINFIIKFWTYKFKAFWTSHSFMSFRSFEKWTRYGLIMTFLLFRSTCSCFALLCFVLLCIALPCFALCRFVVLCCALHYFALHSFVLHGFVLLCLALILLGSSKCKVQDFKLASQEKHFLVTRSLIKVTSPGFMVKVTKCIITKFSYLPPHSWALPMWAQLVPDSLGPYGPIGLIRVHAGPSGIHVDPLGTLLEEIHAKGHHLGVTKNNEALAGVIMVHHFWRARFGRVSLCRCSFANVDAWSHGRHQFQGAGSGTWHITKPPDPVLADPNRIQSG